MKFNKIKLLLSTSSAMIATAPLVSGQAACPNPWVFGNFYDEGDQVGAEGRIYECKAWPFNGLCGQAGFEPGPNPTGLTPPWTFAWTDEVECVGHVPTPVQPFDPNTLYGFGDEVTNQGKGWRCKAVWPETSRCSQAGYAPGEPYNGEALYLDVWEEALLPTASPSYKPSSAPSSSASAEPSAVPSSFPSYKPSSSPSESPSSIPSESPSSVPSQSPSNKPSLTPSESPSNVPSTSPSESPSSVPSESPSNKPSLTPSESPSNVPSTSPSESPSSKPSAVPSLSPSSSPSGVPSSSSVPSVVAPKTWTQLGLDIDGEAASDYSGVSVSSSSDGKIVAIGARYNDGANGVDSGHVRVYEYTSTWTQLGQDIDGEAASDYSGWSVSLSADGKRLAIGAYYNDGANGDYSGHVRVYEYTSTWTQLGQDIDGDAPNAYAGTVSLSPDGNRLAIGTLKYNGKARVYQYGTSWTQLGQDIVGEDVGGGDYTGYALSLSYDGARMAVGAYGSDGANGVDSGHVRVYEYSSSTWVQLGQDIDGEAGNDHSGRSVSLSADGKRVAVGAWLNDGANGVDSGHVRVYEYTSTWTQLGQDIDGEAASDYSGVSTVSLSGDGSVVAVGAPNNDGANGVDSGHVRVYEYTTSTSTWTQLGQDIDGEAARDYSGVSVFLSGDGSVVAVGAYGNDGNGENSGHVRVYEFK